MNMLSSVRGRCVLFSKAKISSPLRFTNRKHAGGFGPYREAPSSPTFLKCLTFTSGFCCTVYVGSSIWNYENTRQSLKNNNMTEWIKSSWNKLEGYEHKEGEFRKLLNKYWNELSDGGRIFWGICAVNTFVFLCWRYPPLRSTMTTYFSCSPVSRTVCWPMFLSTLSHQAPFHLIMNMYVLHSFCSAICSTLGPEQFLAFYAAGGVVSSFMSVSYKLATRTIGRSIGASGAIMAIIGYFCTKYPDSQLGIVFLPNFPFSADMALKGIMILDLSGVIFRWKVFDHAAHLGGVLFGILYASLGESLLWGNRSRVNKVWEGFIGKYIDRK